MKKTLLVFFVCFSISVFSQNKIDKSKNELNSSSGKSLNSTVTSSSRSTKSSKTRSNDNVFAKAIVDVFIYATFGILKYGFVGDYRNEDHLYSNLTPYPYFNGKSGNYEGSDSIIISSNKPRLDIENNFIYSNKNLFGNHLKAKIRPFQYFYFQTDFHQLFETNKIDNTNNRLSLFQFNFNYDRIRLEKFNFGFNLGATYVGNEVKKAGFAYGLNADYFMNKNISFSASAKWSQINSRPVNTLDFQSKFHRKNYFFTLGFEHLKIATPTYNFIALGGGIYF